jgi:WD40 repeat protein
VFTLTGHTDAVTDLAFSPDGRFIVTTSDDTSVRVWSAEDGAQLGEYYEHGSFAKAVTFNPADSAQFATAGWDGVVLLWALNEDGGASVTQRIVGATYEGVIENVSFTPDGDALAFSVGDGTLRIVSLPDGEEIHSFSIESLRVEAAAFAPVLLDDQPLLAGAGGFPETTVRLWAIEDETEVGVLAGHEAQITALAFASDLGQIASGGADQTVHLWMAGPGSGRRVIFTPHLVLPQDDWVSALTFSADNGLLVVGLEDGTIHFWDVSEGTDIAAINARGGTIHAVTMNRAGTMLASAHDDGVVRVWGLSPGG